MHRVLVAVDGSVHADRAVAYVIRLHELGLPVQVVLLNVQPEVIEWQTHGLARDEMISHREYLAGEATANARTALDAAGIEYRFRWEQGEPGPMIAALARQESCDAIAMGTRGMGAVSGLVLGSVATKVVHLADVPVTLTK